MYCHPIFQITFKKMEHFTLKNKDYVVTIDDYLGLYLKDKPSDCILYSLDGGGFKIHKDILGQTYFLRNILRSAKEQCCGPLEILCPCSKEELRCGSKKCYKVHKNISNIIYSF